MGLDDEGMNVLIGELRSPPYNPLRVSKSRLRARKGGHPPGAWPPESTIPMFSGLEVLAVPSLGARAAAGTSMRLGKCRLSLAWSSPGLGGSASATTKAPCKIEGTGGWKCILATCSSL